MAREGRAKLLDARVGAAGDEDRLRGHLAKSYAVNGEAAFSVEDEMVRSRRKEEGRSARGDSIARQRSPDSRTRRAVREGYAEINKVALGNLCVVWHWTCGTRRTCCYCAGEHRSRLIRWSCRCR